MSENHEFWLVDAENTQFCGSTLASSLYGRTDVYLTGELGAGKTTFLNGFSTGLGIVDSLPSPTFALENHHKTSTGQDFIHIDLYRLSPTQAQELIQQTDDHTGIRCVEWSERLESVPSYSIRISLEDPQEKEGRKLTIQFDDVPTPSDEQIDEWRKEVKLPDSIIAHCNAVASFCDELSDHLMEQSVIIRKGVLHKAALLHDLFRFVDFKKGAAHSPEEENRVDPAIWTTWKNKYEGMRHEPACAAFLEEHQYHELAEIVRVHGLRLPPSEKRTVEQQLLYYADKRMKLDEKVSLKERFDDFMQRYGDGEWSEDAKIWHQQAVEIEQELFGGPCPM